MGVTFRSEQAYLMVAHDTIFGVGLVPTIYKPTEDGKGRVWIGTQEEWEALQKLPDPEMVNRSYTFSEGADHNQLTLEREDAIEGMRSYIKRRKDRLITEVK